MNDQSGYDRATIQRLIAALNSTPTGIALLNSLVVAPITDSPRTDTTGIATGEFNFYRSGATRVLQVFDNEGTGAPGWFTVTLS